jgi:hypothetical protein
MTKTTSTALVIAIFSTGCLTEIEEHADPAVSDAAPRVASLRDTQYRTVDLGTADDRACFLSGVAGYLTTSERPETSAQTGAGVLVDLMTNRWLLYVDPASTGEPLEASARCASTASLTPEVMWRAGDPRRRLAPVTATRRCFFTELTTGRDGEYSHGAFQAARDTVRIASDGADWYIDGSTAGLAWAAARCINLDESADTLALEGALTRVTGRLDGTVPTGSL